MPVQKTILMFDLVDSTRILTHRGGIEGVLPIITRASAALPKSSPPPFQQFVGDGGILAVDDADDAHHFAEALNLAASEAAGTGPGNSARYAFRTAAASGPVE